MESFKLHTALSGMSKEVLIIPDDCEDKSIFHVVVDGSEVCKLVYTDRKSWELLEDSGVEQADAEQLGRQIEEYYF